MERAIERPYARVRSTIYKHMDRTTIFKSDSHGRSLRMKCLHRKQPASKNKLSLSNLPHDEPTQQNTTPCAVSYTDNPRVHVTQNIGGKHVATDTLAGLIAADFVLEILPPEGFVEGRASVGEVAGGLVDEAVEVFHDNPSSRFGDAGAIVPVRRPAIHYGVDVTCHAFCLSWLKPSCRVSCRASREAGLGIGSTE
ncbi:hypothetical protein CC78DRAFT_578528 [Lojkania enalia]|uniref:Uncharacterized protein n=1 Tax=Lojkania enalia TaxID=147567 RepID=A0A9P4N8R7_9PLEO|nr:hypothetical protein CC78DRAFT_578528 [Didymosphaeria enalia]